MLGGLSLSDPLVSIAPPWLLGVLLIAACLLAREAGSLLYRYVARRKGKEAKVEGEADTQVTGAIFGLLAFILAFTFSIALDRYDTRRGLVTEEANAIGTTYRRADLFDEPTRSELQATLRQYARTRVSPSGLWDHEMEARLRESAALREKFWAQARAAIMPVRDSERGSYFVESVNQMFEIGAQRELAGRAHVPSRILDVTLLYLLVSAALFGYLLRDSKGAHRHASTVLLVLFAIIIVLIVDLDQPRTGTIKVPQRAMEELVATLDKAAAVAAPQAAPAP